MRAIGYARQSRATEAAASPEAQRQAIGAYAAAQGWALIETVSDIGRSGYDPKVVRPGLEALLRTVESSDIERVIVYKLDRLTRRGIVEALTLVQRIEDAGAALVSVTEPFDTSSALGQGIFALLLSLARAESEKLAERVRSGKAIVRGRGGWLGGKAPYGFQIERNTAKGYAESRLVIDPNRAPTVRRMIEHVTHGGSVRQLVRQLNDEDVEPPTGSEWAHSSIHGLLRSPVLAGWLPDGRGGIRRSEDGEPMPSGEALLTADEWRALQRVVTKRKGRKPTVPSLLGGLLVCDGCGTKMAADSSAKYASYRCNRDVVGRRCEAPARVPMAATDVHVRKTLASILHNCVELHSVGVLDLTDDEDQYARTLRRFAKWWSLRNATADADALAAELHEVEEAQKRLRELYVAGEFVDDPEGFRVLADRYTSRRSTLAEQLGALSDLPPPDVLLDPNFFETLDLDTWRTLLAAMCSLRAKKAARPGVRFDPYERIHWED